jgi:hypothetical protein
LGRKKFAKDFAANRQHDGASRGRVALLFKGFYSDDEKMQTLAPFSGADLRTRCQAIATAPRVRQCG